MLGEDVHFRRTLASTSDPPEGPPPEQPDAEEPFEQTPVSSIWFWLSFLVSPLVALIVVGDRDGDEARAFHEKKARIRREHPELKDVHEAAVNETRCSHCKATINSVTGDGLRSPEREPWVLICNQCNNPVEPDL